MSIFLLPKALGAGQGAAQKLHQVILGQGLEHKDAAAGQKRAVDLEGGILGGGADQDDAALFHKGQESVLLGLVEAVDLVHKDDGLFAVAAVVVRLLHDGADLLDAAGHRRKVDKGGPGLVGNDVGQRRFAHPRRAPEDHGGKGVLLDDAAQHLAGADQMLLAHHLVQRGGAQAGGQRLVDAAFK